MPERRFRPSPEGLDPRVVLSVISNVPGLRSLDVSPTDPAVTPSTASDYYDSTFWNEFHSAYDGEAARDHAPVVFLGDSITYFWNNANTPTQGESAWNSTFASLGAENYGILGDQTSNLLWRVENGELAGKPKVAVVMVGINNLLHSQSPEETAAGVSAVVHEIHKESPRTHLLLLGILPVSSYYTNAPLAGVEQANAEIQRVTRGPNTTFLNLDSDFLLPNDQINTSLYMYDGIHPSASGYQVFANALAGSVESLLKPGGSK